MTPEVPMASCPFCGRRMPAEEMVEVNERLVCEPCHDEAVKADARRDSIDAAWASAEASLPTGWAITGVTQYDGTWGAFATVAGAAGIVTDVDSREQLVAFGDTPAKALRELAADAGRAPSR